MKASLVDGLVRPSPAAPPPSDMRVTEEMVEAACNAYRDDFQTFSWLAVCEKAPHSADRMRRAMRAALEAALAAPSPSAEPPSPAPGVDRGAVLHPAWQKPNALLIDRLEAARQQCGPRTAELIDEAVAALRSASPVLPGELRELSEKATPGPWDVDGVVTKDGVKVRAGVYTDANEELSPNDLIGVVSYHDARLIVAAVNLARTLLQSEQGKAAQDGGDHV